MFPFAAILTAHSSERSPRLVEMEVIGVRGIVVGRKHGSERPAGLVARAAQEGGFRARPCPASRDADAPAVVEDEGRDVDRVAGSVLAPASFPLAVESAAAVGTEVLDPRHVRPQQLAGSGLHALP